MLTLISIFSQNMDSLRSKFKHSKVFILWFLNTDKLVKKNSAAPCTFNLLVCITQKMSNISSKGPSSSERDSFLWRKDFARNVRRLLWVFREYMHKPCIYRYTYRYVHKYINVYVCIYISISIYLYIYIYKRRGFLTGVILKYFSSYFSASFSC